MEKEFKKGDYIVLLSCNVNDDDKHDYYYPIQHCFKQKINFNYLYTELYMSGSTTNGWGLYRPENNHNWRYATLKEATNYDKLDAPYDVRTLTNKTELNYEIY